jgi:UDP:flavonoid glycosyltransferase YjiC (YdhE family)
MARPRLLFAWELGRNLGHASKIREVAAALGGLAEVVVAAREPAAFARLTGGFDGTVLPAPHAPPDPPRRAEDIGRSYPDDLRHCGWAGPDKLAALLRAWRALFAEVEPDLLVTQAAPTAMLAARGLSFALAVLGSGYDLPPRGIPMPPFRWWQPGEAAVVAAREPAVVATANAALRLAGGGPPLSAFADLFAEATACLATVPALDHYRPRSRWEAAPPPCLGQLVTVEAGAALRWRDGAGPRVFAYLSPAAAVFPAAAEALARLGPQADVILAAPGLGAPAQTARSARLEAAGVRAVDGPVRLDALREAADLCISHASNGVVAAFLAAGVPQLGLPTHIEQFMIARVLADQQAGVAAAGAVDAAALHRLAGRALGSARLRTAARAVAAEIAATTPTDPAGTVATALLDAVPRRPRRGVGQAGAIPVAPAPDTAPQTDRR